MLLLLALDTKFAGIASGLVDTLLIMTVNGNVQIDAVVGGHDRQGNSARPPDTVQSASFASVICPCVTGRKDNRIVFLTQRPRKGWNPHLPTLARK